METAKPIETLTLAELPTVGGDLNGFTCAGVTTKPDGTHCAVILFPEAAPKELTWKKAVAWAKEQGGELPSRPVAALIFANVKDRPQSGWHWTSEECDFDASYAWGCHFLNGDQYHDRKSYEGSAVAVRLIPLTA